MNDSNNFPLVNCLMTITDPRINRTKKHNLIDILVCTVCATLAGMEYWTEIEDWCVENKSWLKQYLELPSEIPSHDTLSRVFSLIDPVEFESSFFEWVEIVRPKIPDREIISIDGKTLRGSKRDYTGKHAIITVGAWANELGITLGHISTRNEKLTGEKKMMELLIDGLSLKNTIVTLDANGATPTIAKKIKEKKADIVVGLKNNQKGFLNFGKKLFEQNIKSDHILTHRTEEKGHGRKEIREYELLDIYNCNSNGLNQKIKDCKKKFDLVTSIGRVLRTREINGKTSIEFSYYFTSLNNINEFSKAVRCHWGIENKLHWQLDFTFKEDQNRARIGYSSENLATVRRMTLNMLKKDKSLNKSIRRKRNLCNWRKDYLEKIIFSSDS